MINAYSLANDDEKKLSAVCRADGADLEQHRHAPAKLALSSYNPSVYVDTIIRWVI